LAYSDGRRLMLLKLTPDYRPIQPASVLLQEPCKISDLTWTPDGKRIIYQVWGDMPYLRRVAVESTAKPEAQRESGPAYRPTAGTFTSSRAPMRSCREFR
jgi:hypothetical protein